MSSPHARLIAFYLPQFHPIPENDTWWGKGFTEWTNVSRALPLFPGHNQPRQPVDLGFYDLRVPEVREAQAELARQHGIHGFCYYYYWFENGKRLLERPLEEMLASGKPDFPFCLCWANENWTRRWDGQEREVLMRQDHSPANDMAFLHSVLPYMRDPRYIRVNGKSLLMVYRTTLFPDMTETIRRWRDELKKLGEPDIYLVAAESFDVNGEAVTAAGFDALCEFPPHQIGSETQFDSTGIQFSEPFTGKLHDYPRIVDKFLSRPAVSYRRIRTVMLDWDNTARRKSASHIMVNYSLDTYHRWLRGVVTETARLDNPDERLVFINAWNEWAEGTYLEPDALRGMAPLDATLAALEDRDWLPATAVATIAPTESTTTLCAMPAESAKDAQPTSEIAASNYKPILHLISLTMMGNEADIAESFIRSNLRFLDHMYIILNNAHDGTQEIVKALQSEGLPITIESSDNIQFDQLKTINRVAQQVLSSDKPDWLIPIDSDEFIDAHNRQTFEELLLSHGPRHAYVPWVSHVVTAFDDNRISNPVLRLKHRYEYPTPTPEINPWIWKVFVNAALFAPYFDRYQIGQGGHRVELQSLNSASTQPCRQRLGVRLRHYPVRSHEHLQLKAGLGSILLRFKGGNTTKGGQKWVTMNKLLTSNKPVTVAELQRATREYLDFERIDESALKDTPIVFDPFEANSPCRYEHLRRSTSLTLLNWINNAFFIDRQDSQNHAKPVDHSHGKRISHHIRYLWKTLDNVQSQPMAAYYHDKPRLELLSIIGDPGQRLLDIGCGAGATSQALRKNFPHCHATGIELNSDAAKIALTRLDLVIQDNIEKMALPDPRLPDSGFDTILMADLLEHLVNPWQALVRVRTLLKPGGRLIASIPNIFNLRLLNDLSQGNWHYANDGLLDITHLRFFTAHSSQKMFEETGFRVITQQGIKQNNSELPEYTRDNLSTISTDFLTLNRLSPNHIEQLFNLQNVIVATRD